MFKTVNDEQFLYHLESLLRLVEEFDYYTKDNKDRVTNDIYCDIFIPGHLTAEKIREMILTSKNSGEDPDEEIVDTISMIRRHFDHIQKSSLDLVNAILDINKRVEIVLDKTRIMLKQIDKIVKEDEVFNVK